MNVIQWTEKAFRQLRKIKDNQVSKRIYQEAQSLAHFPDCQNVKRLPIINTAIGCGWVTGESFSSLTAT